jgi:hypothetical protein
MEIPYSSFGSIYIQGSYTYNVPNYATVGKYKTDVVNGCRQAIRTNNLSALIKVVSTGEI